MSRKIDYERNMELLAEKRTQLAEIRTELANERTIMSYLRTSLTMILFGVAFLGFSETRGDFLFYSGIIAIVIGIVFFGSTLLNLLRHKKDIEKVRTLFERMMHLGKK